MIRRSLPIALSALLVAAACSATPPGAPSRAPSSAAPPSAGSPTTAPPATAGEQTPATSPDGGPSSPDGGPSGDTLTIGLFQEPDNLNPYTAVQTASRLVRSIALEGLLAADAEGNYIPELAAEVPTVENGGISEDGLTITYQLKEGVTWSDGHPLTSSDVRFTWEWIMDEANAATSTAGYDQIESIDTPDETTAVVNFSTLYAPALSLFSINNAVLPEHALAGDGNGVDFARTPEGTGPFVISEWNSGQSIVANANPNYREPGKPALGQVIFSIIADQQAGITQLLGGDVQALWNLDEATVTAVEGQSGVDIQSVPSSNIEYLGLNLSMRGMADPSMPHPVLGDPAVREAIASAIDRTPIVEDLLGGRTEAATSPIGLGWAAPEGIELPAYDPAAAQALLEEAGWVDGDGDGVREKDGVRASLEISTPAGQQVRDQTEQLLQQQLAAVGIELVINNVPAATLFGSWEENGKLKRGDFDIVEDTWGADLDPDAFVSQLFASDQIPTEENGGEGWNFFRLQDPELDALIEEARSTLDQEERRATYAEVAQRIVDSLVYIPLYKRALINAFRTEVEGEAPNPWDEFTWNIQDWSLGG